MPAARESTVRETVAPGSEQEGSAVVIEDSVAPVFEIAAGATPADVRTVQVTGDTERQRSTRGDGAHQEKEDEAAVVVQVFARQKCAVLTEAVGGADSDQ